ncbi:MAG: preprotein translocase subunit SecG [Krumholzibacteria bacterium]|nr:preprotein translocase subunit SecG [Candidatus Krumholzibacteria bacterium]
MLHTLLIIIHILVCLVLSAVVLLQSSKGGGLAGAFGGGGGAPQQLLGSRGITTLLHKLTVYLAVAFFVTSFMLFITDTSGRPAAPGGVIGEAAREGQINVPLQQTPADLDLPAETPAQTPAPAQDEGGGGR